MKSKIISKNRARVVIILFIVALFLTTPLENIKYAYGDEKVSTGGESSSLAGEKSATVSGVALPGVAHATRVESLEERLKKKISLDYKDADLHSVLRSIAWTYGLNLVTSPDIKGKVTISLQDVTIEEALDAILAINGLTYTR